MMSLITNIALAFGAVLVLWATVAPFFPSKKWWIRGWDFPRVQIAIVGLILVPLIWFFSDWAPELVVLLLALALVYQGLRILPFTPLWRKEVRMAEADEGTIRVVSANVEMVNEDHESFLEVAREEDPDILFVMETDATWGRALDPVLAGYDTVLRELKDNYYGLVFATRLEVIRAEVVYLTPDDTPSVFAHLKDKAGREFRFIGLHPQPPVPGVDTDERDAETYYAALFARKTSLPIVIMGDFNDSAWSDTSRTFQLIGEYLDPRVGRGMIASFDARSRFLRVPIDQMFMSQEIALSAYRRGPFVGSDHYPMIAEFSADAERGKRLNRTPSHVKPGRREEIDTVYRRYRDKLGAVDYD